MEFRTDRPWRFKTVIACRNFRFIFPTCRLTLSGDRMQWRKLMSCGHDSFVPRIYRQSYTYEPIHLPLPHFQLSYLQLCSAMRSVGSCRLLGTRPVLKRVSFKSLIWLSSSHIIGSSVFENVQTISSSTALVDQHTHIVNKQQTICRVAWICHRHATRPHTPGYEMRPAPCALTWQGTH